MAIFTGSILLDTVAFIATILIGVIACFKYKYTYWDRRGLHTLTPTIPYGSLENFFRGKHSFSDQLIELYHQIRVKGVKHAGFYFGWKPLYGPVDLEIIKHILQTDFHYFLSHGGYTSNKNDPLNGHLFNLSDAPWKHLRAKLTPTFTSGKMKMMFQTVMDCSDEMVLIMDNSITTKEPIDIKEVMSRFTTDVIGSCAFGIECNSLKDPKSEFWRYGKRITEMDWWEKIKGLLMAFVPSSFLDLLRVKYTKPDVEKFFMDVITKTVEYREKNNVHRNDFMHLLLQLKNRGLIADDEEIHSGSKNDHENTITMNELAAQCYLFFMAGYDTSSTAMTFALLELAINQEVQDKLRDEIRTVLEKHNDQITYTGLVNEMTYLDKTLSETLRKYPPLPFLPRECTKDYVVPGSGVCIEKGTLVMISIIGIHHDPEYYPDPEKFDPERFSDENKRSRPSLSWLPFGEGPRACIGVRFGLMQSKLGIVRLLKNYKFTVNNRTKLPIQISKEKAMMEVAGGVWLDVEKIA